MRIFRPRASTEPVAAAIMQARTLDEQVEGLAAELVERAFARRLREHTISTLRLVPAEVAPTADILAEHLAAVIGEQS